MTFAIITNQTVNVSWLLNGTEVQINQSVKEASYTNTSPAVGTWNLSAIATNVNGTIIQTWIWNVSSQVTPTPGPAPAPTSVPIKIMSSNVKPSTPFYIFGWVIYENDAECRSPIVNITNINTSKSWLAETSADSNFFQLLVTNISEGDVLTFNVTDGTQFNTTNRTVTLATINTSAFSINLTLRTPPQTDLAVTDLWHDPETPVLGDFVNVTARIKNTGNETSSTAVFYDTKNLTIFKFYWNVSNFLDHGNDTLTQPGAIKIRVHFVDMCIQGDGSYVRIYDGNNVLIDNFTAEYQLNFSTNWSNGEEIRIESYATNHLYFMIDKYEAVFANESLTLSCGQSENFTAYWNASAWLNGVEDIASGNHTIRVAVDTVANESNTENNNMSIVVEVKPINVDLELTTVSLDKTPLLDGDFLTVTATITNNGLEDVFNFSAVFKDGIVEFNETLISCLPACDTINISTSWNATFGSHTITVIADYDDKVDEFNESNNQKSITEFVNISRDFSVTNISYNPEELISGKFVSINATLNITNLANRPGEIDVGFYLDNERQINERCVGFGTGNGTYHASLVWNVNVRGNHSITVRADRNNSISEFNESNNNMSEQIYIKAPDFSVPDITFNLSEPVIEDVVEINATIENRGDVGGNTTVKFYDTKSIEIRRGSLDPVNYTITLPGVKGEGIRVHFLFATFSYYNDCIKIYDKENNLIGELSDVTSDYWTDWSYGDTIRIETSQGAQFWIDKYEALLEDKSIYLDACESSYANTSWILTREFFGEHALYVEVDPDNRIFEHNETNNNKSEMIRVNASQDFMVTDLSFDPSTDVYTPVNIKATIANSGFRNGIVEVGFYLDDKLINSTEVNVSANGGTADTEAIWNATEVGEHIITVFIDHRNKTAELNELNNHKSDKIFVNSFYDFTITDIYFNSSTPDLYEPVAITGMLKNTGIRNGTVKVAFYLDDNETPFCIRSVYVPANGTNITEAAIWNATGIGRHNITVVADPDDEIKEAIETNNRKSREIQVKAIQDFAVTNLTFNPPPYLLYEDVSINVTIREIKGIIGGEVEIGFYLDDNEEVNSTKVFVDANATNSTEVKWNATKAGNHTITVMVDPNNIIIETNETNNNQSEQIFVNGTDLAVTKVVIPESCESDPFPMVFQGDIVNITATIENLGAVNASDFNITFEDDAVFSEYITVSYLNASDSIKVNATWNVPEKTETYEITVSIPFENTDNNVTNNENSTKVDVCPNWDFLVENVSVYPQTAGKDEDVTIEAVIGNLGHASGTVSVGFYIDISDNILGGHIDSLTYCDIQGWKRGWERDKITNVTREYVRIGTKDDVRVNARETNTTSITWNVDNIPAGNHTIMVVVDPDEAIPESDDTNIENNKYSNNMKNRILSITPPDLSISNPTLDPACPEVGDLVNLSVEVKNNECRSANSTLWWVLENDDKLVATHFYHVDEFSWSRSQPGALMMRVHFDYIAITGNGSYLDVYIDEQEAYYANDTFPASNDVWTDWGLGSSIEVSAYAKTSGTNISFTIDKYQAVIENETITLDAHENKTYNVSWNATAEPGNYTIWVDMENRSVYNETLVRGTDLAITNITIENGTWYKNRTSVLDGNQPVINVTIQNFGGKNATNFSVKFTQIYVPEHVPEKESPWQNPVPGELPDNNTELINVTANITQLDAGASLNLRVPWKNASVNNTECGQLWWCSRPYGGSYRTTRRWTETAQNYTLRVEIESLDNLSEISNSNNYKEIEAHVNISRDFAVSNVSFSHNRTRLVTGMTVTMNVTLNITNFASKGGNVNVSFYIDDKEGTNHRAGENSTIFGAGNGTAYGILGWHVTDLPGMEIAGEHNITVVADSANDTIEFNESNNATIPIYVYTEAADLTVTNISFDSESPEEEENVTITTTVTNFGAKNESNITVRFISEWKGEEYPIANRTIALSAGENKSVPVNWTAFPAGEHFITVGIDPEDIIMEHSESNNTLSKEIVVRGADLVVSRIWLVVNGSPVDNATNTMIFLTDAVAIGANITNVGIKDAKGFNMQFLVDDVQIESRTNLNLTPNSSITVYTNWSVIAGDHIITVIADPEDEDKINETNEENNGQEMCIPTWGAELSGNISWRPEPWYEGPLYDRDQVNIMGTIKNEGKLPAENFNAVLIYDYREDSKRSYVELKDDKWSWDWHNETWAGARCVYVHVKKPGLYVEVYNVREELVGWCNEPCWVRVEGDTAKLKFYHVWNTLIDIDFYAGGNVTIKDGISLDTNETENISMMQVVSTGNHTVKLLIDTENKVAEGDEDNNSPDREMHVKPTRDFTVTNVTVAETDILDAEMINITAEVANVGFRNGTTGVSFVDYESETRTYRYRYSKSILPHHYVPVSREETMSPYPEITIHRLGVDAIRVHFNRITLCKESPFGDPAGRIWVCDENGRVVWSKQGQPYFGEDITLRDEMTSWIHGDTVYIDRNSYASFNLGYYTNRKEFNRSEVTLNATETMNQSKNITVDWTASTGNHFVNVIMDPDGMIGEINESNNNFICPLNVNASRDVTVANITFDPPHPMDGEDANITVTVKNNGTKEAIFTVDLWADTTKKYTVDSVMPEIYVPDASWACIHLRNFTERISENDNKRRENVWIGSASDTIKVDYHKPYPKIWWWTVGGIPTTDEKWYEQVDKIRYLRLLNRTRISLGPYEEKEVNAMWYNMTVSCDPAYMVTVIVDPEDEIDEMNENNNEQQKEIMMFYPDFTVAGFISPTLEAKNASVVIKEAGGISGVSNTTNITVRFRKSTIEEVSISDSGRKREDIRVSEAVNIRAHFKELKLLESYSVVRIEDEKGNEVVNYSEEADDFWTPWVTGNTLWINYLSGADFEIDRYQWEEVKDKLIDINASENVSIPIPYQWNKYDEYDEPQKLTVTVDPDNNITELVEGNNSRTGTIYTDLTFVEYKKKVGKREKEGEIHFVQPAEEMLCMLAEEFEISATIKNNNETEGIVFPAPREFNITLEVRDPDDKDKVVFRKSKCYQDFLPTNKTLYAGEEEEIVFKEKSIFPTFPDDYKYYKVSIIADSKNDINEANDFYPQGEGNNATSATPKVYSGSGYLGGDLYDVTPSDNRIYGDVVYSIGNSHYQYASEWDPYEIRFSGLHIPSNVARYARLYLYWVRPEDDSPDVDMEFNGVEVSPEEEDSQTPTASTHRYWYGTYAYNVTDIVKVEGINEAKAEKIDAAGLSGMLLLVVYEDESKPRIKYWITEGAELMMAKNERYPSGLGFDGCIANASFVGDVNKSKVSKAELLTVLASWSEENLIADVTVGDALMFNGWDVGSPRGTSYWDYEGDGCMALTLNHWEDVTDYLGTTQNKVEIQSKGNFMMATNAFFKVTYLPDLTVSSLNAPSSVNGGVTRKIEATIRNIGESKAEHFKVRFTASDGTPEVDSRTVDLLEPNNKTTVNFTWTAPDKLGALELIKRQNVTITVEADSEHNVNEENAYGEGENNNIATKDISVTITEKPLRLSPGGSGPGTGTGIGEGGEAEVKAGSPTGGSGKATAGESGGKAITGYLMKGTVARSEVAGGGGGERGEFSLVKLLLRLAMLAVAAVLVYVGYLLEWRRQRHKQ